MGRFILCLGLLLWQGEASAQNYLLRYVTTTSGAITFTGNTLGLAKQAGANLPGTIDSIGAFITLNTNLQVGSFPPGTTLNWTNDSSAALLTMPSNSTVLYAELIWGGLAQYSSDTSAAGYVVPYANNPITLTLPNGMTSTVSPDPITASFVTNSPTSIFYVRSANVTALVQAGGVGFYSAGGIPGTVLASDDNNNCCGWTLAVVYGNPSLHQRNLSLFVGDQLTLASGPPPPPAVVSGFCSPPTGPVNARLAVSVMEGDPNKTGDQMLFGTSSNNLTALSGPNNPNYNFFGSQINDDNGLLNTNGTFGLLNSVPATGTVTSGARQGWDITSVDVSSGLTNGVSSAYAQGITGNDGFIINGLAMQIDVGSPVLTSVQSVDKASTFVSDTLTYTVTVTNSGTADAINLVFNDPLPFGTSFVTNTFATNGVVIPGADPQNGVYIPLILQSNTMTFTYKVTVNQIPPDAKFITAATINFQSTGPCAESPIINSTIVNLQVQTLAPLLALTKTSTLTNVVPGGIMTYTISVPNNGATNDYSCALYDPLPVGLTYIPGTTRLNGNLLSDIGGGNMPYSVKSAINGPGRASGVINVGDTATVTFQVQIATNPPAYINNVATFYDLGPPQEVSSVIPPIYADLAVGITANPAPVAAGSALSYTITVTNLGPNSATTLYNYVTLSLPLSPYFLSPVYTPSVGVFDPSNGVWSGINLPSNSVISMTVSGEVSPAITTSNITSAVTVSPPLGIIDPFLANNSATNNDPVIDVADLAVSISDGVSNVYPGEVLFYTITTVNYGPSTLNSFILSNNISSLLQNVSQFPAEGTYNPFNGVWNGVNLAAGGSVTMTLVGTVPDVSAGTAITNSVTVADPTGFTDPVLTNNFATDTDTVITPPVLDVLKTGPTNVFSGTNFSYSITVTNAGGSVVSNVVVYDNLPANVSFQGASGGGMNSGGVVSWSLLSLAGGTATNFSLTVATPAAGNFSVTNIATVTGMGPGTNTVTNASPPVITMITPLADLGISKTGPSSVVAGTNFNYTITVTNYGPSAAGGIVVTDTLPAGLTFIGATSGGATNALGQVIWSNVGTLAANTATNLILTVQVGGNVNGLTNVATVWSPIPDPYPPNNTNTPSIIPVTPLADLGISKAGPSSVAAGTNFNYTITVTNLGPSAASGIVVTDALPAGLTFVNATASGGINGLGQVIWSNVGPLAANTATNLILTVQVGGNVNGLTNVATVWSPIPDPYPPNNTNTPSIIPVTPLADLGISKTGPGSVVAGTNFNYTITLTNYGPSAANSIVVTDTLPAGLTFIGATSGGATNNIGQVVWSNVGTLAASAGTNLNLTVQVGGNVTGLTNVATVWSPIPDPYPPNNTNTPSIIPVTPLADLGISKTGPSSVTAGTNFNYTITVTNLGPSAAGGIVVTDALPAGLTFVNATASGGINGLGQVIWPNVGPLAANTATNLILTVQVGGNVTGLTNVATVWSPIPDPYPPNNTNTPSIIPVTPLADLGISKTGPGSVVAGTNFNYTIILTNYGPSAANSIVVTDTLPAGLTFIGATSGGATNNIGQVVWSNVGTLAASAGTNLTLTVQVGGNVTGLTNVATVWSPIPDPYPPNNTNTPSIIPVGALADLGISKTGPSSVVAGTNFNYTITVTNLGPSAASGIVVTDALPAGLTFVNATASGGINGLGQVIWSNVGPLAANTATNLILTVQVGGNVNGLTNVATVWSPIPDPYPPNNTNTPSIIPVTPLADLGISKTGPASVVAGTNFNYTITVTNLGPSAASGIVVTDALPAGLTFVNATASGGVNGLGQVIWPSVGPLAANTATNLTLTVQVGGNVTGLTNVATVWSPIPDPYPPNNTNTPSIIPVTPLADLGISKTGPGSVTAGTNFNYTITLTNYGPSAANSIVVTDALPAGLTFIGATSGGATNAIGQVIWSNVGTLAANAGTNITLTVQVGGNVTGLTNLATVWSPIPDPYPPNNTNTPSIIPVGALADLAISKTGPSSVVAGTNFNYTITITNLGPSAASGIVVTDALPAGLTFVNATASGGINGLGQVIWPNLGPLAANTATNLTLTVQVGGNVTGLTNVATVWSPIPDPYPPNNTNTPSIIPVTPLADLGISKTGPASVVAGTNFNYIITVTNYGPSDANGIVVTDALPAGLTFVNATASGTINGLGQVIWYNFGPLAANTGTNLTLTVQVGGNVTGLTNVASVWSPIPDPYPPNNTNPPVIIPVMPLADLGISKTGPSSVVAGTNFNYIITVTNYGPSAASGIVVTDALPAGLTFVNATSSGTINGLGQVIWYNLAPLAANTGTNLTLTVQVGGNVTGLTNVASVWSPIPDPYPPNNTNPPVIIPVTPLADLGISKTGPSSVAAGTNFNYIISVTNYGPSSASGIVVTDALPAGLTFVNATASGTINGLGQVIWYNLAPLAANTGTNLTLTVQVGGNVTGLTNVASVWSPIPDPYPPNNTNPPVIIPVTPLADVAVFKTGTTSVAAGGPAVYTLTATNYGPSTASNVVVRDIVPAGFTVPSGAGYTVSNNVVSWTAVSLAPNASVTYSLTVTAPGSGTYTNIGFSTSTTMDPNTNNNNGTPPQSRVVTTVSQVNADVFVLLSGPTNVLVSSNFTYTISVTNQGPAAASNVVVQDTLPTNVVYVTATGGGGFTNLLYTWPVIPLLPVGSGTNFTLTVYATSVTTFTNVASSTATSYDPNLTNNNGSLPASQAVTAATQVHLVPQNLAILVNSNNFNPQSSLYDEVVVVTNVGTATARAVRLTVAGLPSFVTLYNASGTNAGIPYVQNNFPLAPGGTVEFVLEFYDSLRQPFTNLVSAFEVPAVPQPTIPANAVPVPITSIFQSHISLHGNVDLSNTARYVINFKTVAGHSYTILYSDSLYPSIWYVVTPYINANATAAQWFDDGPPKTKSPPSTSNSRFYRVIEVQ